ncbi:glycosyltransferase family 2 protein [Curvibacter sp. RS43]|uniref:glycosyltransferase family 2 protein n=1 Tax=Curvibacter microcysteis TaxID=3026419 RepID=UPI00235F9F4F|nr:glycosyltransferase family 2 protein [Curvibacter sp. RS43]MDD0810220.1 glycosyltransferase family 2 protein [Curvibacter sp. RS43]
MITVVIPLYNKVAYIERAVRSVIAQSFEDWELIVVDDLSTDGSKEVVLSIKDPRIRLISLSENGGVSNARNVGVLNASYEWVAFLDADDEFLLNWLDFCCAAIKRYQRDIVITSAYYIDIGSDKFLVSGWNCIDSHSMQYEFYTGDFFQMSLKGNPVITSSCVCVPRASLIAFEGFPVGIKSGEDLTVWALISADHKIIASKNPNSVYHRSTNLDATWSNWFGSKLHPDWRLLGDKLIKINSSHGGVLTSSIELWIDKMLRDDVKKAIFFGSKDSLKLLSAIKNRRILLDTVLTIFSMLPPIFFKSFVLLKNYFLWWRRV